MKIPLFLEIQNIVLWIINPNKPGLFSKQFIPGGAQSSSNLKSAVSAIPLHTKQQKTFLGTLGTQDYTTIGSKTSLGPSMGPTGPLSWILWFLRKFWAVYTNPTFSIL